MSHHLTSKTTHTYQTIQTSRMHSTNHCVRRTCTACLTGSSRMNQTGPPSDHAEWGYKETVTCMSTHTSVYGLMRNISLHTLNNRVVTVGRGLPVYPREWSRTFLCGRVPKSRSHNGGLITSVLWTKIYLKSNNLVGKCVTVPPTPCLDLAIIQCLSDWGDPTLPDSVTQIPRQYPVTPNNQSSPLLDTYYPYLFNRIIKPSFLYGGGGETMVSVH